MSMRTGWIIAFAGILAGTGIAYVGMHQGNEAKRERDALQGDFETLQAEVLALRGVVATAEMEEQDATLQSAELAAPSREMPGDAISPDAVDAADLLDKLLSQVDASEGVATTDNEESDRNNAFEAYFTTEQATMMVNMEYGAYLREAPLSAEQRQALRELLADFNRGLLNDDDAALDHASLESWRDEAIRELLGPAEYANFEAFEEVKHEHAMAEAYDMQLRLLSPGLPDETREYVRDVFVSEYITNLDSMQAAMATGGGLEAYSIQQTMALDAVEARLREELLPEDFELVLPVIEQQRAMVAFFDDSIMNNDS